MKTTLEFEPGDLEEAGLKKILMEAKRKRCPPSEILKEILNHAPKRLGTQGRMGAHRIGGQP